MKAQKGSGDWCFQGANYDVVVVFASAENPITNYSSQFDLNGTFFLFQPYPIRKVKFTLQYRRGLQWFIQKYILCHSKIHSFDAREYGFWENYTNLTVHVK